MKKFFFLVNLLPIFLLFSCATPYQSNGYGGGFSEMLLSSDMLKVSFKGNGYTGRDTVNDYYLRRCAELTLKYGFSYFVPVNENSMKDSNLNMFNNQISQTDRHQTTGIIKMYKKGTQPEISYEADVVLKNFQTEVIPEEKPKEEPVRNLRKERIEDHTVSSVKFGFGFGGILSSEIKGKINVKASGQVGSQQITANNSDSVDEKLSSNVVISAFARTLKERELGFIGGFDYIMKQEVDVDDSDYSITSFVPKFSLAVQINPIYFFGGFNYSFLTVNPDLNVSDFSIPESKAVSYDYKSHGGIGYQLGIGFLISDNLSLELENQWLRLEEKLEVKYSTYSIKASGKADYFIRNLILGLKYSFN